MSIRRLPHPLATACLLALAAAAPVHAADHSELTIYRSDNPALYASQSDTAEPSGYAVVREQRTLQLTAGSQDVVIGNLPRGLDAEAVTLGFPDGQATIASQRLLLGHGADAALNSLLGREVTVLGDSGATITRGKLLRANDGLVVADANGATLVRNYAAVHTAEGGFPLGASLDVHLVARHAGAAIAQLSYPGPGLGWRAAYVGTLQPGAACNLQLESRASIANRSDRDWRDARVTLIAGKPNMAKPMASRAAPVLAMANAYSAAADTALPQQDSLDDYRSYTLPEAVDLPADSVSQVALYAPRTVACTRTALFENGSSYRPPQPMLAPDFNTNGNNAVITTLQLTAFDSLPAGYLRVLTADRRGTLQFIGEDRLADTAKGAQVTVTLGTAFDLRGERTRTAFAVDQAGHTLDEAFRITLHNAGDTARTVTVREHPTRWRQWTLAASSDKPSRQTTDTLDFAVNVPAGGKATLTYAVRYQWTAKQPTR